MRLLQHVVEAALDPCEARIVDAGVTDDMCRQTAIGIDAALLMFELQPRDAELIDIVLLGEASGGALIHTKLFPEVSLA